MRSNARAQLKYGASLDQGRVPYGNDLPPFVMKKPKRAPLVHTKCFDESTEFDIKDSPPRRLLSAEEAASSLMEEDEACALTEPVLSKSLLNEEIFSSSVESENNDENLNKKVLRTQLSIDIADSVSATYERNYRNRANEYFYERAVGGSNYAESIDYSTRTTSSATLTTTALVHNNSLEESPPVAEVTFRQNRLQGTSENCVKKKFVKQNRVQRLSSSSLQVVQGVKESSLSRLFDKLGTRERLVKSKRLSTSALYDDKSPTEMLYKSKSGSGGRLSSIQLFEKFCSEDFGPLYNDRIDYVEEQYDEIEDFTPNPVFNFYENPLDRESVTALYERFCVSESGLRHPSSSTSSSNGAIRKQRDQDNVFTFDSPSLPEETTLLSRGSETETSFNDDFISSFNDDFYISSITDDLLSPNLETESDRTILQTVMAHNISDQYEPCFNVLQPKRRSIKKHLLKQHSWNLENLKLKAIDSDSSSCDSLIKDEDAPKAVLANIDETNSIETNDVCNMSSRLSMHKLQPFCCQNSENNKVADKKIVQKHIVSKEGLIVQGPKNTVCNKSPNKVVDINATAEVQKSNSIFFRVKRDKQANAVTVHRKTRCFPL